MSKEIIPGVFIAEKDSIINNVVDVATDIPAFIGYTEKAENGEKSLLNSPTRITSIHEYRKLFGGPPQYKFHLSKLKTSETQEGNEQEGTLTQTVPDLSINGQGYQITQKGEKYSLFNSLRLFFQNGGSSCYIVSVGSYDDAIDKARLMDNGIPPLSLHMEPTMIVVPEAIRLKEEDCASLQQAVLSHCEKMESRVGILDVYNGFRERRDPNGDVIENFRTAIGLNSLGYGVAYYPWLHTTIVSDSEIGITNITNEGLIDLKDQILLELNIPAEAGKDESSKTRELRDLLSNVPRINDEGYDGPTIRILDKNLKAISPTFNSVVDIIKEQLNLLTPSAAMAGIYTMVDNSKGVWSAPANVSLSSVIKGAVNVGEEEQANLNTPIDGKAINPIRSFRGRGTLVWGARTLDGNSNEWRYISVRRTMIMLEQSIKAATRAYVFEPNDANTWTTIKSMIDSFLHRMWSQGALVGATPVEAYSVRVGLGTTMTQDDISQGILKMNVLLALVRPAEFMQISLLQQMQRT